MGFYLYSTRRATMKIINLLVLLLGMIAPAHALFVSPPKKPLPIIKRFFLKQA